MADDLYLVIELKNGRAAAPFPLLVSHQPEGVLEDSSKLRAQQPGVVVYSGPAGWVACDRRTDQVKSLAKGRWEELGLWRLKLVEGAAATDLESLRSTGTQPSGTTAGPPPASSRRSPQLAPFLLIHDAARPDQPSRREVLPTKEGGERMLGRSRGEGRIVLEDRRVSRDHLRFYCEGDTILVENLSQYPPTMEVNGEHLRIAGRMRLPHKARIRLGGSLVEFIDPLDAGESALAIAEGKTPPPNKAPQLPPAPDPLATATTDPSVQEGFDWVEKTLILLALLLVIWLVYFLMQ